MRKRGRPYPVYEEYEGVGCDICGWTVWCLQHLTKRPLADEHVRCHEIRTTKRMRSSAQLNRRVWYMPMYAIAIVVVWSGLVTWIVAAAAFGSSPGRLCWLDQRDAHSWYRLSRVDVEQHLFLHSDRPSQRQLRWKQPPLCQEQERAHCFKFFGWRWPFSSKSAPTPQFDETPTSKPTNMLSSLQRDQNDINHGDYHDGKATMNVTPEPYRLGVVPDRSFLPKRLPPKNWHTMVNVQLDRQIRIGDDKDNFDRSDSGIDKQQAQWLSSPMLNEPVSRGQSVTSTQEEPTSNTVSTDRFESTGLAKRDTPGNKDLTATDYNLEEDKKRKVSQPFLTNMAMTNDNYNFTATTDDQTAVTKISKTGAIAADSKTTTSATAPTVVIPTMRGVIATMPNLNLLSHYYPFNLPTSFTSPSPQSSPSSPVAIPESFSPASSGAWSINDSNTSATRNALYASAKRFYKPESTVSNALDRNGNIMNRTDDSKSNPRDWRILAFSDQGNGQNKSAIKSLPQSLSAPAWLANKNPDDVLTVQDLQAVLEQLQQHAPSDAATNRPALAHQQTPHHLYNPSPPLFHDSAKVKHLTTPASSTSSTAAATQHLPKNDRSMLSLSSQMTGTAMTLTHQGPKPMTAPTTPSPGSSSTSSGLVAFPQPSILQRENVKWGSTVAAAILGMILGASLYPNLWLIGAVLMGLYGFDVGKKQPEQAVTPILPEDIKSSNINSNNVLESLIVRMGRRLARWYLLVYDACISLFFMYKTGQLSYDYYKRYESLDQRFAVQAKIDAWNSFFSQGKENFDKWEKENEVGRKVLATLRTVWLVEERSKKKVARKQKRLLVSSRRRSRYRLVQFLYDVSYWIGHWFGRTTRWIVGGTHPDSFVDFIRGALAAPSNGFRSRFMAAVTAVTVVTLLGSLFAISPFFVVSTAVVAGGILWPTWIMELMDRGGSWVQETRARGRRGGNGDGSDEIMPPTRKATMNKPPLSSNISINAVVEWVRSLFEPLTQRSTFAQRQKRTQPFAPLHHQTRSGGGGGGGRSLFGNPDERKRYHYYWDMSGRKQYYRTGQPWFFNKPTKLKSKTESSHSRWRWWQNQSQQQQQEQQQGRGFWPW